MPYMVVYRNNYLKVRLYGGGRYDFKRRKTDASIIRKLVNAKDYAKKAIPVNKRFTIQKVDNNGDREAEKEVGDVGKVSYGGN